MVRKWKFLILDQNYSMQDELWIFSTSLGSSGSQCSLSANQAKDDSKRTIKLITLNDQLTYQEELDYLSQQTSADIFELDGPDLRYDYVIIISWLLLLLSLIFLWLV